MEKLEYRIEISAPVKTVWETMLNKDTYQQWVEKSWPNSTYDGKWAKGEKIRFVGPDGSGTLAELVEVTPYQHVLARHIAVLGKGGVEDHTSAEVQSWIGTIEEYRFSEKNGKTTLIVNIETGPKWKAMFDEGWPPALEELKRLSEQQLAHA